MNVVPILVRFSSLPAELRIYQYSGTEANVELEAAPKLRPVFSAAAE